MRSFLFAAMALAAVCAIQSSIAQAGKWGMAGCGVGSLVFEDKPGKIQILAATTNDLFTQTFSISSGTSNCVDDAREVAKLFMEINRVALEKDIARGEGETLTSLSEIYGCEDSKSLGGALQRSYDSIYSGVRAHESREVPTRIESLLQREQNQNCKVLS